MHHVLSLIADPRKLPLAQKHIAQAGSVLAGHGRTEREARWLGPEEAWECRFEGPPAGIAASIREAIGADPVDINVLSAENRRKLLLIADMDSTMIHQECIDELAVAAGVGDEIKEITRVAMRGEMPFEDAMRQRVARVAGLPESAISRVLSEQISYVPGGRTLVATMKAAGAFTALISGGFTQFTSHVAAVLGFEFHRANELIIEDGKLAGTIREPVLGQQSKIEALEQFVAERNLQADDTLAVGDGANDIGMLIRAGLGVAMHAKPAVREAASVVIDHGDLRALLYLQGYARQEFAANP